MFIDSFYRLHYPDGATHLDNFLEGLRSVLHELLGSSFFGNGCVVHISYHQITILEIIDQNAYFDCRLISPLSTWPFLIYAWSKEGRGTKTLFFCSLMSKYVICMYPYQVNNVAYRHNEVIIKFSLKLLLQHVQDTFIICRFSVRHAVNMINWCHVLFQRKGCCNDAVLKKEPWNIMIIMAKLGKNCIEGRWTIGFL